MNKIKGRFLRVSQPIGEFYCSVMKAKDLHEISFSDVRHLEREQTSEGFDTYLGIQRDLKPERVKKINEYIHAVDATFPNSIIIAIDERYISIVDGYMWIEYSDYQKGKVAKILDGQHRLAGFEGTDYCYNSPSGEKKDFELLVTIFVEADQHTQAQVFTMVNQNQTKVNRSLVYDLESLALARSPTKTAHQIASLLNSKKDSPFYQRIKRLGLKTDGIKTELITQAAFVESLVKLISRKPSVDRDILLGRKKNFFGMRNRELPDMQEIDFKRLPFRKSFAGEEDSVIAANIYNFFSAVKSVWPNSWRFDNKQSVLNKTVGLMALMRLLRDIYNDKVASGKFEYGGVIDEEEYVEFLASARIDDSYFSEFEAVSKSGGIVYKDIKSKVLAPKARFYHVSIRGETEGVQVVVVPGASAQQVSEYCANINKECVVGKTFWAELSEVSDLESGAPVFIFEIDGKVLSYAEGSHGYGYLLNVYHAIIAKALAEYEQNYTD
ncbi:DGQHR domain-containing protein [Pseudomonas lactis]|uniref:DGQHR domain-containing protein n=1 Tax=Pseudomonas lactis TaxID=1615674 RepID=UPI0014754FBD|nr:DGQHR domain-containing protein [Pseudomonas lactis]NNA53897.1 DGQHR domain-containing protein [Pseudomonas lactis]